MCDPMTIAASVGAVGALGGAGLSAYGQYRQGQFDAQVARNNAQLAEYQAADALQRGASEARQIENEGRRIGESARVAIGANNVAGGSMDQLLAVSAAEAAQDAERVRANAARAAWGFRNEAADQRARARMAKQAGVLGALGTGLSGVGAATSLMAGAFSGSGAGGYSGAVTGGVGVSAGARAAALARKVG